MEKSQLENLIVVIRANETCLMVGALCQGTSKPRFFKPYDVHVCLFVCSQNQFICSLLVNLSIISTSSQLIV